MTKFNKKTKGKEKKIVNQLQEEFNPSARDPFQDAEAKERDKRSREIAEALRKSVGLPPLEEEEEEVEASQESLAAAMMSKNKPHRKLTEEDEEEEEE